MGLTTAKSNIRRLADLMAAHVCVNVDKYQIAPTSKHMQICLLRVYYFEKCKFLEIGYCFTSCPVNFRIWPFPCMLHILKSFFSRVKLMQLYVDFE